MTTSCEEGVRFGNTVIYILCFVLLLTVLMETPGNEPFQLSNFVRSHKSCTSEEVSYMHNNTCLCYAYYIIMLKTSRSTIEDGNN